jgi:hypothetical protein
MRQTHRCQRSAAGGSPERYDRLKAGHVTQEEFFALFAFIFLVLGVITGAWWRVESKIAAAEKDLEVKLANAELRIAAQAAHAQLVQQQLLEHKTHVAEHYVSKAGHRETMDTITGLIKDMGSDIRGLRDRLDKFMDGGNKKSPP